MPAKIKKVDGYKVTHGDKVSAKKTTNRILKTEQEAVNAWQSHKPSS